MQQPIKSQLLCQLSYAPGNHEVSALSVLVPVKFGQTCAR